MNAGLPGTGLGGLFYLIGALWMPISAVHGRIRGRRDITWAVIVRQSGIALGVFAALWLTGWSVGYLLTLGTVASTGGANEGGSAPGAVTGVIHWVAILGTAGLLGVIITIVQVLRFTIPRPVRSAAAPPVAAGQVIDLPAPDDQPRARARRAVA